MKVALVGIGKIAVDQHVPAINASPDWELAATVSRKGSVDGVESLTSIEAMLVARPDISVVSLALPPVPRFEYARAALMAGRHVMLEKPPGATLAEIHALSAMAADRSRSLFATWHSRMAHAVAPAKAWLADKQIMSAHITWREDVRKWHPGQDWVFEPGGMGVFDPGINALSILTEILPAPVHLTKATLEFPANR
ncbi:MAG: Gfo/Idh/MocA family protein, partial [Paracoccaceae bacterium]